MAESEEIEDAKTYVRLTHNMIFSLLSLIRTPSCAGKGI